MPLVRGTLTREAVALEAASFGEFAMTWVHPRAKGHALEAHPWQKYKIPSLSVLRFDAPPNLAATISPPVLRQISPSSPDALRCVRFSTSASGPQFPQAAEGTFSISIHRLPPEAGEGADVPARQVIVCYRLMAHPCTLWCSTGVAEPCTQEQGMPVSVCRYCIS